MINYKIYRIKSLYDNKLPYPDNTANGLSFGFKDGWKQSEKGVTIKQIPKSLDIIFREVERDVYNGFCLELDATLNSWAEQGVLLLNTILTVERAKPKSHEALGWQRFIKIVLFELAKDLQPKVFILWGEDAKLLFGEVCNKLFEMILSYNQHLLLFSKHPAADLHSQQWGNPKPDYPNTFAGNSHFSKTNEFLKRNK